MARRCFYHGIQYGHCGGRLIQAPPSRFARLRSFVSPTFYCEAHHAGARARGVLHGRGLGLRAGVRNQKNALQAVRLGAGDHPGSPSESWH